MIPFDELCAALERHQARRQAGAQPVESSIDEALAQSQAVEDPAVAQAEPHEELDDALHEIELPDVLSDEEDSGH